MPEQARIPDVLTVTNIAKWREHEHADVWRDIRREREEPLLERAVLCPSTVFFGPGHAADDRWESLVVAIVNLGVEVAHLPRIVFLVVFVELGSAIRTSLEKGGPHRHCLACRSDGLDE